MSPLTSSSSEGVLLAARGEGGASPSSSARACRAGHGGDGVGADLGVLALGGTPWT